MNLRGRLGISFIFVTHDQEEAMTVADRVAVMDAGRILEVGPPRRLYERPGSRAVPTARAARELARGQARLLPLSGATTIM
jgi:ABC-type Fe3+/spermidine/putrescine transport system ATPase subunit